MPTYPTWPYSPSAASAALGDYGTISPWNTPPAGYPEYSAPPAPDAPWTPSSPSTPHEPSAPTYATTISGNHEPSTPGETFTSTTGTQTGQPNGDEGPPGQSGPTGPAGEENEGEYSSLKQKINEHLTTWARQQSNLITDNFANASEALDKLIARVGSPSHAVKYISDMGVNIAGALGLTSGQQILSIVVGAAANAVADTPGNSEGTAEAIKQAIQLKRQELRDNVEKTVGHWNGEFAKLLTQTEPRKDVSALRMFKQTLDVWLPYTPGVAPKPTPVNQLYGDLLLQYAAGRGWRGYISGSSLDEERYGYYWNTNLNAINNGGILYYTDWPGILDPKDIAQELNKIDYR